MWANRRAPTPPNDPGRWKKMRGPSSQSSPTPSVSEPSAYPDEILRDGPSAFWRFGGLGTGGGHRSEVADGRRHRVFDGGLGCAPGPFADSGSWCFDGKAARVEVPHDPALATDSLSVEFWFCSSQVWDTPLDNGDLWRTASLHGSATLLKKANPGHASGGWCIAGGALNQGSNEGRVIVACGATGMFRDATLVSPPGLNDGRWHHIVWTRSENGSNRLYVDGDVVDVADDSGETVTNVQPLFIGGLAPTSTGSLYEGQMAEIALYPAVLSGDRVRAHHAASQRLPAPPFVVAPPECSESVVLLNDAGLSWEIMRYPHGWTLGRVALAGEPLELPVVGGVLSLFNAATGERRWLPADRMTAEGPRRAVLDGRATIDGAVISFSVEIDLHATLAAANVTPSWSVDRDLFGYEVCFAYHQDFAHEWRSHHYPFAGNSEAVTVAPMRYCGVPAALIYRDDLCAATLFAIDTRFDYLNPTSWTGGTGFHFKNGLIAPEFRMGGGRLLGGHDYRHPLQLFASRGGNSVGAVTELVNAWIEAAGYQPDDSLFVRTPVEALDIFTDGRRKSPFWVPGVGYLLCENVSFVLAGELPLSAFVDYRLFERTGNPLWRERAFAQMDFSLHALERDPSHPHCGVMNMCYDVRTGLFHNRVHCHEGYMVDMCAFAARYMLLMWERVKMHEDLDGLDWHDAAVALTDWVVRQQNPDGGLPQVVNPVTGHKSRSVVSHRALCALPAVARIAGDSRYLDAVAGLEQFLRSRVEGRFWFTGAHVDLPASDFEQDSVWGAVEYWLDKHDRTGERECLDRAVADALLALLWWCPKQLSWVTNPTQGAHAEQQNYCQYSVYCYTNRKIECLERLAEKTGTPLFAALARRVMQLNIWTQVTGGDYEGGLTEAVADPWLDRRQTFDWRGISYNNELSIDLALQILDCVGGDAPSDRACHPAY